MVLLCFCPFRLCRLPEVVGRVQRRGHLHEGRRRKLRTEEAAAAANFGRL